MRSRSFLFPHLPWTWDIFRKIFERITALFSQMQNLYKKVHVACRICVWRTLIYPETEDAILSQCCVKFQKRREQSDVALPRAERPWNHIHYLLDYCRIYSVFLQHFITAIHRHKRPSVWPHPPACTLAFRGMIYLRGDSVSTFLTMPGLCHNVTYFSASLTYVLSHFH